LSFFFSPSFLSLFAFFLNFIRAHFSSPAPYPPSTPSPSSSSTLQLNSSTPLL
jgi:hypothetical protein